ncbi:MAG: dihydropteroate synthase [Pseudomonadales bacterium]
MSFLSDLPRIKRPVVMGILNVTPDSFFDGGRYDSVDDAVARAWRMVDEGADIIDIGGESTRPGAEPIGPDEELARVMPVIESLRGAGNVLISIDTSTPEVMRQAANAGANLINDVRALQRKGAMEAAADTGLPVCLMHMQGDPSTMQQDPYYSDLLGEIREFFEERIDACRQAGIDRNRLILDPGFGFGKTPAHNLQLLNRFARFKELGLPLLVGLSRKSTIGKILEGISDDRLMGSVAGAVIAVTNGASIVRTHDIKATCEALQVTWAVMNEQLTEN